MPVAAKQENISEHPTSNTDHQPATICKNPANSYENLLTVQDHVYDALKVKKTCISNLSLMCHKEGNSKYEQHSTVDKPRGDP